MSPLFIPGPVDVDPQVLAAQTKPMLPHRSIEFEAIFQRACDKVRELFFTKQRIYLTASSGTGMQEAAVRNFVNDKVLCCVNGAFGRRWYEVALTNGKDAIQIEFPWNEPVSPERVADTLCEEHFDAITVVHNETSTGLQNPIAAIAAAVRETSPETLICVDAVSSLGGVKIEMDVWGVDMLLTSSQKCLALPPGLGLCAVSGRALEFSKNVPNRGWYFDFLRMEKHRLKDSTPATPAVSLIYALDIQLDRILAEGLEKRFARHAAMAELVQTWALTRDLDLYAPEGYRSATVTNVVNSKGWDIAALNRFLNQQNMRISNGYEILKEKTFRIAHMGETSIEDINSLLKAMDQFQQYLAD